jgi:hypothetical protein
MSKEKKFIILLNSELETKNFLNLRKLDAKISIQQRYRIINRLLSSGKLQGILLAEKLHFFSIENESLSEIRNKIKTRGTIKLSLLKDRWKVKNKVLEPLLQQIERGIVTEESYYTIQYLQDHIISVLSNEQEYELKTFSEKLNLDIVHVNTIIQNLINEKLLDGVIKNQEIFLNAETFEEIIQDYIEDQEAEIGDIQFDEISKELGVRAEDIEKYLLLLVDKIPGMFVVYPLEKKIIIKK